MDEDWGCGTESDCDTCGTSWEDDESQEDW